MDYSIEMLDDKRIIKVVIKSDLYPEETAAMGAKIRLRALDLNYMIILDFRDTTNYVSLIQGHNWFSDFYTDLNPKIKFIPTVHITNAEEEKFFQFVETPLVNNGVVIKVAKDEESAIEWLDTFE